MRSKDMAELAGVTPRTVRHYHQIGLLAEPERDRNGYRRYGVPHLVRLLRIKGLAAAGVALGDMPAFLDDRAGSGDDLLDTLDRQLVDQIARLEQQRRLVARLKRDAAASGAGPDLDRPFKLLTDGRSDLSNEAWREQLTLFSHLLDAADLAKLYAIYDRLAGKSDDFLALGRRFDALGSASDEREIAALARDYAAHFRDMFAEFRGMIAAPEQKRLLALLSAHTLGSANEGQRRMFAILSAALT